jgi:hypothetical protein
MIDGYDDELYLWAKRNRFYFSSHEVLLMPIVINRISCQSDRASEQPIVNPTLS